MQYGRILSGTFLSRPNRFVAKVLLNGKEVMAHVKNTGRCKELLVKGATVYLEDFSENMGKRKLPYSLISVEKRRANGINLFINMDSQAPNKVVREALENGTLSLPDFGTPIFIKPEATLGTSRLDFYIKDHLGTEGYLEVKGVTLEEDGTASFPDAPTTRGIRHLQELSALTEKGYRSYLVFVIQMKGIAAFSPNKERHIAFAEALQKAREKGVFVLAYDCIVSPNTLVLDQPIPVIL